jgi:TetR/AcrR family acrAB operon transcriptional repressor
MARNSNTRQRILQESLQLFSKHGFHGTTFQQIADAVGITQPGVFIHFKNKMDLFAALREEVALSNREFVDTKMTIQDTAIQALQKHCCLNLEWVVKNPDQSQLIILLYHYSCFDPAMRDLNRKALETGQERILKYILSGVREKLFHTENPRQIANDIHCYIIGQSIQYLSHMKIPTNREISKNIDNYLARIIQ